MRPCAVRRISIRIAAAFAAAAASFTAAPLLAAPAQGSAVVRYADLDLATPSGAATLRARVERAASRVCGTADNRDLTMKRAIAACRSETADAAHRQVEVALAEARSGRQLAANEAPAPAPGL